LVPSLREAFNLRFRPEKYVHFLGALDDAVGAHVDFRVLETPVFFPKPLVDQMARYGRELVEQLEANPKYSAASGLTIPAKYRVPKEAAHPLFVQADFGLVKTVAGEYEPKLVEIQGFPSLYAFHPALARQYKLCYELDPALNNFLGGLDETGYQSLFRKAVLGEHAPEDVVLLEVDPFHQKTLPDFLLTRRMLGCRIADVRDVDKRGRKLYHAGKAIERIYNRVIVDELERRQIELPFRFSDDLDVEWAGHPNWFFRLSKFSLPWFNHVCVPKTKFLSDVGSLPENLDDWVLKPLYSFAGLGVKVGPTRADIDAVPVAERDQYILQERMDFAAPIETPSGPTKPEIRIMYIWDGVLKPVTTIIRTGRGKMMGVDFNKNLDWVGASAGLFLE
jgi:hypothetical protein